MANLTLTCIRPANVEKSLLRPPSFQENLSGHTTKLYGPFSSHFISQESWSWFESYSLFQLFVLVHCCPLLPKNDRALCTSIFTSSFGHKNLTSILVSSLKINVCQTHHCPCRSPHLSPHLNCLNLPHPRFSLFTLPFSGPNSFCPVLSGQGGKFLLCFNATCFHE